MDPLFKGKEVSCRPLGFFFKEASRNPGDEDRLLEGVNYSKTHLKNKYNWIDWESNCKILQNAAKIWGEDHLVTMGQKIIFNPVLRPFWFIQGLLKSPIKIYRFAIDAQLGGKSLFRCVFPEITRLEGNTLYVRFVVDPGYRPIKEFFLITMGTFIAMPEAAGHPKAQVDMKLTEDGCEYEIKMYQGLRWITKIRSLFTLNFKGGLARELQEHMTQLEEQNQLLQREILEKQKLAENLRNSISFSESLTKLMSDGFFVLNGDQKLVLANPAIEEMTGYSTKELQAINGALPFWSNEETEKFQSVQTSNPYTEIQPFQTSFKHKNGRLFPVEVNPIAVKAENEKVDFYMATVRDLTESQKSEAEKNRLINQLERKNAELERFTYTVSHELKSPLVTINGFLGFLKQDIQDQKTSHLEQDLQRIENASLQMGQLLDELLELSRIGRHFNEPEAVPLNTLLKEVEELLKGPLSEAGMEVQIESGLPTIMGDRQRLKEVFQNLIENATKFRGDQPKPSVCIGLETENETEIQLFVRDNGIGIPKAFQQKVFGLFDKLHPDQEGSGVGLALVKRIVEFHDGQIWIESDGKGQGTTVMLKLARHAKFERYEQSSG